MKQQKPSGVIQLIQAVWDHANEGKGHSWTILNSALHEVVTLAIKSGFKFDEDDFATMHAKFRGGYWMGNSHPQCGEGFYTQAARGGFNRFETANRSACMSFEKWVGRKPFLMNGERLTIGSEIMIGEKRWYVTSFAADNLTIGVSGYYSEKNPYGRQEGSPTTRKKLTHADVKAIQKGRYES